MRVLHVISSLSRGGGGPSRSAQGLVAGLNAAGVETWLMTLNHGDEPWSEGVTRFVNGGIFEEVIQRVAPDIVHLHGLWNLGLHRCAAVCRRRKIPYVIAPRGMLEPWSLQQKCLKKRIARWLYQDRDLRCAAALHATAESEAEQFRKLGFKNPIIVSPNGVNVPVKFEPRNTPNTRKRVLFVSRMHPKKGVMELVEAWRRLKKALVVPKNDYTQTWYNIAETADIVNMPVIQVERNQNALLNRRAVKDVFKSFGVVENENDGRHVIFPAKSAGKMLGQRGVDLYGVADSFAKLFRASRRAWSETEAVVAKHKRHRNIDAYHQYIAKFAYEGEVYYARFTIREDASERNPRNEVHSSTVSRITVYKAKGAELSDLGNAQVEDSTPFVDNKIAYFFARVNPLSNWCCELVYTMNGDFEREYEAKVKAKVKESGLEEQFIFTGALNDDEKWAAYVRADLFVLPTYSENFGIVVAEALWAGVPVITTKGTPWKELEDRKCGKWIDLPEVGSNPSDWPTLVSALTSMTLMPDDERREMGKRGRKLVEEKYTWDAVVKNVIAGYEGIEHQSQFAN